MNKHLEILIGISGSGKSTFAHNAWERDPYGVVVINRDKIRELLFSYTEESIAEYYKRSDVSKCEKAITKYENVLIKEALAEGKHVIVDATHLKKEYLERFKYFNVPTKLTLLTTDVETAIARDKNRTKIVGEKVIRRQYEQYKSLVKVIGEVDLSQHYLEQDINKPPCYVIDIDGTIAEKGDRNPYDWKRVGEDQQIESVVMTVKALYSEGSNIILCSGRDEVCRPETRQWLSDNEIAYDLLLMRPEGDVRADYIVKEELWRKIMEDYNIIALIDDRAQVVDRARALGLKVFQVEYNNF